MAIPILSMLGGVSTLIDKFVPDPGAKQQIQAELEKASLEVDKERVGALKGMMGSSSIFISGGIPALIWIGAIALFTNYVVMPWAAVFGYTFAEVHLPEQYWTLLGWIITGLFAKKSFDNNEIHLGGKLFKRAKDTVEAEVVERRVASVAPTISKALARQEEPHTTAAPVSSAAVPAEEKTDEYFNRRFDELTAKYM
jgi:hypothetical protein